MNQFRNGYALLVGVGEHTNPDDSLPATVKDVEAIETLLRDQDRCAYLAENVRMLHDAGATKSAILDGLAWLRTCAARDPRATVIVYYSGHGERNEATEDYYLIPHDGVDAATRLAAQELRAALDAINAERLLVILDCCHAAGMGAKGLDTNEWTKSAPSPRILGELKQGSGRAVFSSSLAKQKSFVRRDRELSIFTYHLLEALQGADNRNTDTQVTVANLMHHLGKTVKQSAQAEHQSEQTPFFRLESEEFAVALIRAGQGFAKGSWNADAADAHAAIDAIAPPTINAPIQAKHSNVAVGNKVDRDLVQNNQSGGMNLAGATLGDGAMLSGRAINRGTAHVSGGTVYGSVVGETTGTINHTSGGAAAASAYQLTIVCEQPVWVGRQNEVSVRVSGTQANTPYRVEVRAPNIQASEAVHGAEAVLYITPQFAGPLNLRAFLYQGSNPTPLAQTLHQIQIVKE